MIKFFRNKRYKNLSRVRAGRYFKYAIGEIILVVIGILIALQINNYNEQRKENKQERAILLRLKQEFESNKNQLEIKIKIRNHIIENGQQLLTAYDGSRELSRDSLIIKLSRLTTPPTFDPVENDLVSSGNLEILKNEELKRLLINWSTDVIQLQEVEQYFVVFYRDNIVPYYGQLGIGRDVFHAFWDQEQIMLLESDKYSNPFPGESKIAGATSQDILSDVRLEGLISHTISFNVFSNIESKTLMKRIEEILKVINSEIEDD